MSNKQLIGLLGGIMAGMAMKKSKSLDSTKSDSQHNEGIQNRRFNNLHGSKSEVEEQEILNYDIGVISLTIDLYTEFLIPIESPRGTIEIIKERVEDAIRIFSALIEDPTDIDPMSKEFNIPFRNYQSSYDYSKSGHSYKNSEPQLFDKDVYSRQQNTTISDLNWWYENIEYDEDSFIPNAAEEQTPYENIKIEWNTKFTLDINKAPKRLKEVLDVEVWSQEFLPQLSKIIEDIIKDYFGVYYLKQVGCSIDADFYNYEEPEEWTIELQNRKKLTINGLGLPWNTNTPLWHATVAYRKIMFEDQRFKSEKELANQQIKNALGGDAGGGLSTTLDYRVACAVAIGLNVVRKIAIKEITLIDLINYALEHGVLEESVAVSRSLCRYIRTMADAKEILNGNIPFQTNLMNWSEILGKKGIPPEQVRNFLHNSPQFKKVQEGRSQFTFYVNRQYLKSFLNIDIEDSLIEDTFMFYRTILKTNKFYDPLFFGTRPLEFKNINEDDIGIICSLSSIPRVTTDTVYQLYNFGFTRTETETRLVAEALQIGGMWGSDTWTKMNSSYSNEYLSIDPRYTRYANWQDATYEIDPISLKMNPSNTMEIVASMSEIRVFDLQKLNFVTAASQNSNINWGVFENCYSMPITKIKYRNQPLNKMITFPNFPDNDKEVLWPFNLDKKQK